jgi:hypothetical protein
VHHAQQLICDHIKKNYSVVKRIMYLSDGCASHFKNNLSMLNLVNHNEDFGYKAEWIFYSVSNL